MTTLVPFKPVADVNFTFLATLDGADYNVVATWNFYAQRYYITVNTVQGERVVTLPLIASPDTSDINLTAGYFTDTLIFRASSQTFEVA